MVCSHISVEGADPVEGSIPPGSDVGKVVGGGLRGIGSHGRDGDEEGKERRERCSSSAAADVAVWNSIGVGDVASSRLARQQAS